MLGFLREYDIATIDEFRMPAMSEITFASDFNDWCTIHDCDVELAICTHPTVTATIIAYVYTGCPPQTFNPLDIFVPGVCYLVGDAHTVSVVIFDGEKYQMMYSVYGEYGIQSRLVDSVDITDKLILAAPITAESIDTYLSTIQPDMDRIMRLYDLYKK